MADEELKNEAPAPSPDQNQPANEPLIEDVLRIEGIKCKGYGIIPKAVTTDKDLSTNAIAIYAYFCSLSGKGDSPFPSRGRILSDINISKKSYYKGLKELTDSGYIVITQEKHSKNGVYLKNIYTITEKPKKYATIPSNATEKERKKYKTIMQYGLDALGYGIIPYAFMSDSRLKATPKAVYAYISSFAGDKGYADLSPAIIQAYLKVNIDTLQRHIHVLRELNYINAMRLRIDGKFSQIERYYINKNPDVSIAQKSHHFLTLSADDPSIAAHPLNPTKKNTPSPTPQEGDTDTPNLEKEDTDTPNLEKEDTDTPNLEKEDTDTPNLEKEDTGTPNLEKEDTDAPDLEKCDTEKCDTEKEDTIINSLTSNSITSNSSMIDRLIAGIRKKIEYSLLELSYGNPQEKAVLDALVTVVVETLLSQNPRIEISGTVWLPTYVKDTLLTINGLAVSNVMERYLARADKVDNPKKYLLVAIFNELRNPTPMEEVDEG